MFYEVKLKISTVVFYIIFHNVQMLVDNKEITEEEYELIKEFMTRKDEENGK